MAAVYTGGMVARSLTDQAPLGGDMGKVFARLEIRNAFDLDRARTGEIAGSTVRMVVIDQVLVDTGATTLCLPADVVAALGLPFAEEVNVATATGISTARLFEGARVTVEGRTRSVDCLERPGGATPLLGVIPLESLGLELDLKGQRLRKLPDHGPETYLTILRA
jgi:predicted aspartyl protease